MKKINAMLTVVVLVLFSLPQIASSKKVSQEMRRYGIKKAFVEYQITGSMQSGTEALYFDDWGVQEAKYTRIETKVMGMKQSQNTATYLEGMWQYTVDLDRNTGSKMENPFLKETEGRDVKEMGRQMMVNMGGRKIGTDTFLGKKCDIWEIHNMGSKTWIWNWIPLKSEVNMSGMKVTYTATKIGTSFDAAKLERPRNISYNDMGNVMDLLKKMKKKN